MKDYVNHCEMRTLSVAVSLACVLGAAQAQSVDSIELLATGSFKLGASDRVNRVSGPDSYSVDVLEFPPSNAAGDSAGLHTYGNRYGTFGSRSSGYGSYDVTGAFQFKATVTNYDSQAKAIKFKFYITPGLISNEVNAGLTGDQFLLAGTTFNIAVNGSSVWASSASLRSDAKGLGQFSTSGFNLYSGAGLQRTIEGRNLEIDLGVLNAGESLNLVYDLTTNASGNSPAGAGVLVPKQTIIVPEQWVDFCGRECNYGGGYGELQPGDVIVIPEYTTPGTPGGSHASSGDPFSFGSDSIAPIYDSWGNATLPQYQYQAFEFSTAAVPEPSTYALILGGLGLVAWRARRRPQA